MTMKKNGIVLACVATLAVAAWPVLATTSVFKSAPNDPRAVTVKAKGDGRADDTDAIQQALDQAAEHGGGGLVFLPSGRYRISHSLFVWPAVRVFGVGSTRPVLVLGNNTPGFQKGLGTMVVFTGARRGTNARDIGGIDRKSVV